MSYQFPYDVDFFQEYWKDLSLETLERLHENLVQEAEEVDNKLVAITNLIRIAKRDNVSSV